MIHYFDRPIASPRPKSLVAACGKRVRLDRKRPSIVEPTCAACAATIRCACGALIGAERAALRLTACLECARGAAPKRLAMHGDESSGRVWATLSAETKRTARVAVDPASVKLDPVEISPAPTGPRRGVGGRFAPVKLKFRDAVPARELDPIADYMLVAHRTPVPIPGETDAPNGDGFFRARVKPQGSIRPNPWDRAPRDAGRRDFEAPTEAPALREWAAAHALMQAAREACSEIEV